MVSRPTAMLLNTQSSSKFRTLPLETLIPPSSSMADDMAPSVYPPPPLPSPPAMQPPLNLSTPPSPSSPAIPSASATQIPSIINTLASPDLDSSSEDAPGQPVLLSHIFKSKRIELSDDRLSASSNKGYRMVRATHGVTAGTWYFEIKIVHLGPTGHTRLGWATNEADIDTPVGYDAYGFGYRDIDGSKVTKAWRDKYAHEGYGEGDVLGFYISLPKGEQYEPEQPNKGMPLHVQVPKKAQKTPDSVPGSEISYFKNGVCQGSAFKDIPRGRYYPAASMYTMPNEPNCIIKFNFGPNFEFFPQDFGGLPIPQPMSLVPHQAYEVKNEGPAENAIAG